MEKLGARPTIANRLYRVVELIHRHGSAKRAVSAYIAKLRRGEQNNPRPPEMAGELKQRFGKEFPADLRVKSSDLQLSLPYEPVREHIFCKALQLVTVRHSDYVFVDIGAGKGFALLVAAEHPFKRVVGIELSETLTRIARENIQTYGNERKCHDIQCICADATNFTLPPEPIVLYLFNPFQGRVMDRMLENIKASLRQHPRDLWIIYVNPWEDRKFRRSRELQLIASDMHFALYRTIRNH
ncbi:MAG: class I SAM-dependent methyltransferase [Bryobacteraceae bacterium]